jgi:hypothetical protein
MTIHQHPDPNRYCSNCKHEHGPLYICESYTEELKQELEEKRKKWIEYLNDPNSPIDTTTRAIFKWFAGVK